MNHIGIQYWPMRLQPSDYCEITISCQVCWRMRRWHNGRTRRSPNPKSEIVLRDCSVNGEESAAHSILARSDPLQQRPYTFAQTNLWRPQISLAVRRRTIHSCQVCWRMRRWHNGRTRRSPNPKSEIVLRDCSVNGEESAAHSILARSDPLQQRPYTFAQTHLWRLQISLAARRRTIH